MLGTSTLRKIPSQAAVKVLIVEKLIRFYGNRQGVLDRGKPMEVAMLKAVEGSV